MVLKHTESMVSAFHNYLINHMLTPGFMLGNAQEKDGFFFLADKVQPGKPRACISARFFDAQGRFLLHLMANQILENPGQCTLHASPSGFRVFYIDGTQLLSVNTQSFTNGYLTKIQGKLYDQKGLVRMEPFFDHNRVFGQVELILKHPLTTTPS